MAKSKVKLKKSAKVKPEVPSDDEGDEMRAATAGNVHAPDKVEVDAEDVVFRGDEDGDLYHVIKGDHSAIVRGNSKADAREAFFALFGILDTTESVKVGKIDEDDLASFSLNEFGVILKTR